MPAPTVFIVNGRRTSLSLEAPFLDALRDIACRQELSDEALVSAIETANLKAGKPFNLCSAVRVFVTCYYRDAMMNAERRRRPPQLRLVHSARFG
ncbi:putative DNA-binding ribbon-helix-helix protein [Azospirillum sp. OGB3]|uniref:ribbon-helix-helix domain-containing protein n=1 Tax=Azospirillum sp. OGB3 TaxID=2587012 RepID=UPI001605F47C|nr:ribbon-helix-helix domain-containing protein [Azospirillum sp. OGB3]MBB3267669.1 putative DNA-binding ribbon-helix-helix protein [Azospirillum sp. OGB3]